MRAILILLALCSSTHAQVMQQNGTSQSTIIQDIAGQAIAPASVATTGDAVIGGQLVVKGTATVQGTSFSVGGSTFSCSGGSCSTAGVKDGSSASGGFVGEFISTTPTGAFDPGGGNFRYSLATTTLTAGDWDVHGMGYFSTGAALTGTIVESCISLTQDASDSGRYCSVTNGAFSAVSGLAVPTMTRRISVTVPTAVYLVGRIVYSANTGGAWSATLTSLSARRAR